MKAGHASTTGGTEGHDVGFIVAQVTTGDGVVNPGVGLGGTGGEAGRKGSSGKCPRDCPVSGHKVDLNESDAGLSKVGALTPGTANPGIVSIPIIGVAGGVAVSFELIVGSRGGISSSAPVVGRSIACCSARVS